MIVHTVLKTLRLKAKIASCEMAITLSGTSTPSDFSTVGAQGPKEVEIYVFITGLTRPLTARYGDRGLTTEGSLMESEFFGD